MPPAPKRPVILLVLDGWGYRPQRDGNAIALASTPTWDALWKRPSRTLLDASGLAVGLPAGQMGNSEVGHLNLGAGRVVQQDLVRISAAINSGDFFRNPELVAICKSVKARNGTLHLAGLIGNGGVHAVDTHLFALIDLAERLQMPRVAIHGLLDGRDTLPTSGAGFVQTLLERAHGRAHLATLYGRYFGMDRDKRWQRTELWYAAMVRGAGNRATDPVAAVKQAYERGETDEFVKPIVLENDGRPVATIRDGDGIIFFNYRSDRVRQIVRALTQPDFDGFDVHDRPTVDIVSMTQYEETFTIPIAFPPQSLRRIVAEVISERGMTMFRTAETEKYPHVTYFFNCGYETPFAGEVRELVPSQKVATYDLKPEMSAPGVTDVLCRSIESGEYDFTLCNYANGDMVGHTGVLSATIAACETVDRCLARVLASADKVNARVIVTADHGNCEMMIDPETGGPHTAHTTNQVPLVLVDSSGEPPLRGGAALCDVGPTILSMLGVEQPSEMTGKDLRHAGVTR